MQNEKTPEQMDCGLGREKWATALARLMSKDPEQARAEVRQVLIDAIDAVEQTDLMEDLLCTLAYFDGASRLRTLQRSGS